MYPFMEALKGLVLSGQVWDAARRAMG